MTKYSALLFFIVSLLLPKGACGETAQTISQYGITWTFDKPCIVGRFVTGDYWVVGPVVVRSVDPAPEPGRNGSMVNPQAGIPPGWKQGYDNRGMCFDVTYDENSRATFPLSLCPGESLISSASVSEFGVRTPDSLDAYLRNPLRTAAVLTCVDSPPPTDAFRPAYVGQKKTIWTVKQLHREILPRLPVPPGAIPPELLDREKAGLILDRALKEGKPSSVNRLATLPSPLIQERLLQRFWLDYGGSAPSGPLHPIENMLSYGREITHIVSTVGLMLLLDDPKGENEQLLRHYIQLGIDYWGVAQSSEKVWVANGGIDSGRKWPVIFAGLMLGSEEMANVKATSAEDEQTYFGKGYRGQTVLWRILPPPVPEQETQPPEKWKEGAYAGTINDGWRSESYRLLNGPTWVGEALAARLMGATKLWNHDPFFEYVERWVREAPDGTYVMPKHATTTAPLEPDALKNLQSKGYTPWSDFVGSMWQAYRPKADEIGRSTAAKWSATHGKPPTLETKR